MKNYEVRKVERKDCEDFILNIHYAKRWPSISYYFGLFHFGKLVGVVTYGTPFSSTLRSGVAGENFKMDVIELNRLCLRNNLRNEASFLVGKSLKMLDKNQIIVSYADASQNHIGYVYQATNFLYCGLSAKRTDWKIKGKEHLHNQTITDIVRGCENRVEKLKELFGEDFYLQDRPRKHRYIYIVGSKTYKNLVLSNLKYKIEKYPKGGINARQTTD